MTVTIHGTRPARSPRPSLSGVERVVSIIWYRSKAKLKGALARRDSNILKDKSHPHKLPPEIVGMIIAHLAYDIPALKACSATCLTWYNFVCPYLHYALIFRHKSTGALHSSLDPLLSLRGFGLLPFVRKVQFDGRSPATPWVVPAIFNPRSMRCFRLLDLQELAISHLDFSKFPAGVGEYLGHFSSTLRSLSLMSPLGSRRQLLEFFMLFLRLDNIKICDRRTDERHEALDRRVAPTIKGGLRGQLELKNFNDEGLLKDMIVVFGGLRFTAMRLEGVVGVPLLLRACMNTLEAVYIYPGGTFHPVHPSLFDFSRNTVLRSLEVPLHFVYPPLDYYNRTIKALLTITSPVFSEVVIVFSEGGRWQKPLAEVLREMYTIKQFRVVFCLQILEKLRTSALQRLTSNTEKAVAEGIYDFLICPPVVCSRPISSFDYLCQSLRVMT